MALKSDDGWLFALTSLFGSSGVGGFFNTMYCGLGWLLFTIGLEEDEKKCGLIG